MTRKKAIVRTLLIICIIITICREMGWLNLRYYNSQISSSQAKSFNDFTYGSPGSLQDVPLIVKCMGYEYGQSGTTDNPAVIVYISGIRHGALWIPLFKQSQFTVGLPTAERP